MFRKISILFLSTLIIVFLLMLGVLLGRISAGNMHTVKDSGNDRIDNVEKYSDGFHKLDLNSANYQQLTDIPGVTKSIANAIIQYREDYGKFYSVSELKDIKGIGQGLYETIKEYVTVE